MVTKGNHRGMEWEFMIFMDIYIFMYISIYVYGISIYLFMYISIYAKWFGKDQSTSYSSSASYFVIWK
jgi:hypothetical protein